MTAKNMNLYAFWEYDQFPYVLGSPVREFLDNGMVKVTGFGGSTFRPILVVPLDEGERIQAKLQSLRDEYRAAQQEFEASWAKRTQGLPEPLQRKS